MDNSKIIEALDELRNKVQIIEKNQQKISNLEDQISSLTKTLKKTEGKGINVEIGTYDSAADWDDTDTLVESEDDYWEYHYEYHVDFDKNFQIEPEVLLSITAFIVNYQFDIWVYAKKITKQGFDLHIKSSWDLDYHEDWEFAVNWLAIEV